MSEGFGGSLPTQGLAWPAIELCGDEVEVVRPMHTEVGALGEVLAEQAVGVLVGASLPRACRVAEVNLYAGRHLDLKVVAHLVALVPGQGLPDELGPFLSRRDHGLLDLERPVSVGQVQKHDEASRSLDQRADG